MECFMYGRELGAFLLALVDADRIERDTVEALLRRIDDEPGGWTFDRLYYLSLAQFAVGTEPTSGLQGGSCGG